MEETKKNNILIVDDDKLNLMVMNRILGADYILHLARDGNEAIDQATKLQPDLILLDIMMPGVDGFGVISALRKHEKTREIPVIFITGLNSARDEVKGLALGANDYINKPFNEIIVQLRVRNHLKIVNQMREILHLSMIDTLTELPNRRSFDQHLHNEWKRAVREKTPMSVLMVDVDHFKNYNDKYGHPQGDAALRSVADAFRRNMKRPADFSARWGGEEFVALLARTDGEGAMIVAELVRETVEQTEIPCKDGTISKVTISIGVNTQIPKREDLISDFVSRADTALYAAKNAGRNKVCVFDAGVSVN